MLLDYDGLSSWEEGVDYEGCDGLHDPEDCDLLNRKMVTSTSTRGRRSMLAITPHTDYSSIGGPRRALPKNDLLPEISQSHHDLRKKLVAHFKYISINKGYAFL